MKPRFRNALTGLFLLATTLMLAGCVTEGGKQQFRNTNKAKAIQQYTELGLRYIQQGDTVKAMVPLKRALELAPKDPGVHNAFAILFQAEKEPDLADEYFRKSLKFGPKETRLRNNYAAFLFAQQRYTEACAQLESAAEDELYEKRSAVYENLGLCYLKLEQEKNALEAFERAISINDSQPRALLEASTLYFNQGDIQRSDRYHTSYQRLVRFRMARNTPKNLWLGVRLARETGDKNKEASYALQLRNLFPDSEETKRLGSSL